MYCCPLDPREREVCQAKEACACVMSPEPAIYIGDARELTSNIGQ